MVKSKSKKQKKKGASLEDVFGDGAGDKLAAPGGWKTSVADMALDQDDVPKPQAPQAGDAAMGGAQQQQRTKKKKRRDRQPQAMVADEDAVTEMDDGESLATGVTRASGKATSVVPGLGVVVHSMKRGDHTARQKQRKVVKVKKALARMDKVGTKLDGKQRRRTNKLGLKHMY